MPEFIESDVGWFDHIPSRIKSVFLNQLTYKGCFCEVHAADERCPEKYYAGIWGWNTWCGIQGMIPLADENVRRVLKNTLNVGLSSLEPKTGMFPHAVLIGPEGIIGSRVEYRTYGGEHGESYNLDNVIFWMTMVLEFALHTRDLQWFTADKLEAVENCVNYILENCRGKYNPRLIEAGIEGDWTENTDWEADNAIVNAGMFHCLRLLAETCKMLGYPEKAGRHSAAADGISAAFNEPVANGGFWDKNRGYYIQGNDGTGKHVYGDIYFDTTSNIFALLWDIADKNRADLIWKFIDSHPEIEMPYPVLTNLFPRNSARRPAYGRDVCNGDIWFCLGALASVARLKHGYAERASEMFKAILDYELREGTMPNNIYPDGTVNASWNPEVANYGSLFILLSEGLFGLQPSSEGLIIRPRPVGKMKYFKTVKPLYYASKPFYLEAEFRGPKKDNAFLLRPDFKEGTVVSLECS